MGGSEEHRRRLDGAWTAAMDEDQDDAESVRRVHGALATTSEAYLGLCAKSMHGRSGVGEFAKLLEKSQRTFTSGERPVAERTPKLLPIPLSLARPHITEHFRRKGDARDTEIVEAACGILAGLNFLYCVGWTDTPILPESQIELGPAHHSVLRHLWASAGAFLGRGVSPFDLGEQIQALRDRAPDYSGGTVSVRRNLVAAQVIPAWPKVGHACVRPIVDLVDAELRAELEAPESILLPVAEWPLATPRSKVYASDDEWYQICEAGYQRGMLKAIQESEIFVNDLGERVTAGAMGVDKVKEIDGRRVNLLRFICILTPVNAYMRRLEGDSWTLPQSSLLSSLILNEGEFLWLDGEDLESCFNLFTLPDSWAGYFAFSKPVAATALGGQPGTKTFVTMRAVPMGWTNSVALLQNFLRNLLFKTLKVSPQLEVHPRQRVLKGDAVVACLDGADYVTRLRVISGVLRRSDGGELPAKNPVMEGFVAACASLGLPLNHGKKVVEDFHGAVLGGELDGIEGVLRVGPDKSHQFVGRTCALLAEDQVTQVGCQHWTGLYCFSAGFRRPLFSVVESIFTFIIGFESSGEKSAPLPREVRDEVLLAGLLAPMAFSNLRCPLRETVSITDASEHGGAAGEASKFVRALSKEVEKKSNALELNALESTLERRQMWKCSMCDATGVGVTGCPLGCAVAICSVSCYDAHRGRCSHAVLERCKVVIISEWPEVGLRWECLRNGLVVEAELPGRKRHPDAGLVFVCGHLPSGGNLWHGAQRLRQNGALRQVDAFRNQLSEGRLACIIGPCDPHFWAAKAFGSVLDLGTVQVVEFSDKSGPKETWYRIAHNLPCKAWDLFQTVVFGPETEERCDWWSPRVARCLVLCAKAGLAKWDQLRFPVGKEEQQTWMLQCLLRSTRGFSRPGVAAKVCDEVAKLVSTMQFGNEKAHLEHVLQFCDFRGSEVSLREGTVNDGQRQTIPYPATAWDWKCIQSYPWKSSQHINVLELVAFFYFLSACSVKADLHGYRFLHIVDSRVVSCVLAKGRSSSTKLNRILRRVASLLLAADLYALPMWTISGWNFADFGSRAVRPAGD